MDYDPLLSRGEIYKSKLLVILRRLTTLVQLVSCRKRQLKDGERRVDEDQDRVEQVQHQGQQQRILLRYNNLIGSVKQK